MRPGTPIHAAALAAVMAGLASGLFAALPLRFAAAAEMAVEPQTQSIVVAASDFGSRSVALGVGKSVVIDFPRDIKDVLVANPRIANAVIRSSRRAYVIGNEIGQTNVFFFDAEGKQLAGLDIAVTRNLNGIRAAIKQVRPDSDVRVEGIGMDGVILSGFVSAQRKRNRPSTSRRGSSIPAPPRLSGPAAKSSMRLSCAAAIRSC
jgi:pilus assembly protein CpaC